MNDGMFNSCLNGIESGDLETCLNSIRMLDKYPDPRSLEVLKALIHDSNPRVKVLANSIYNNLKNKGLKSIGLKKSETQREVVYLFSNWDVLDEVGFIYQRNFSSIIIKSFKYNFFKIVFGIFVLMNFKSIYENISYYDTSILSKRYIGLLCFIAFHELFMRPIIWLKIAGEILQGFKDRKLITIGRGKLSKVYIELNKVNLIRLIFQFAIPVCFLMIFPFGNWSFIGFLILTVILLGANLLVLPLFPLILTDRGSTGSTFSRCIKMFDSKMLKELNFLFPTFLFIICMFYFAFAGGLIVVLQFLSAIPKYSPNHLDQFVIMMIIVDFIIDPFWIGFQLLVTRYMLKSEVR